MRRDKTDSVQYFVGFLVSLVLHLGGFAITILIIESSAASSLAPQEIFTVTLEGGERLGGISQVPLNDKPTKVLPAVAEKATQAPDAVEQAEEKNKAAEKEITQPTVVEDPEKILEEKKKAEELKLKQEKELKEKEKQKAEEKKKKEEAKKAE